MIFRSLFLCACLTLSCMFARGSVVTQYQTNTSIYPVCANVTWTAGNPDVSATLMDCITRIANPYLCPSYISNSGTKTVYVSFSFNNLMDVSELEGTVTMDFYFRLYWTDERLNFPSLWDAIKYNTSNSWMIPNGIDITELIRANEDNLRMWLPDVHFVDGKSVEYLSETIRVRPYGVMYWSRHTVATLQQPGFYYETYPQDEQTIEIRIESYGLNSDVLLMNFTGDVFPGSLHPAKPVSFISNGAEANFQKSPTWTYTGYYTDVLEPDYGTGGTQAAYFPQPVVYINVKRQSTGVIYRLAFPIMLMLLLVGLTFWEATENRVDTTINILLAVSALYIVIFSSIPMLGYLTHFDRYIITMFIMIVGAVFAHQLTDRMILKVDTHPLRMIFVRVLELVGKLCIIPYVVITFVTAFPTFDKSGTLQPILILISLCFSLYIFLREFSGVRRTLSDAMLLIRKKVENPSAYELSTGEILLFNLYSFGVFSRSASHYHQWKRMNDKQYMTRDSTTSDMSEDSGRYSDLRSRSLSTSSSGFDRSHVVNTLHHHDMEAGTNADTALKGKRGSVGASTCNNATINCNDDESSVFSSGRTIRGAAKSTTSMYEL